MHLCTIGGGVVWGQHTLMPFDDKSSDVYIPFTGYGTNYFRVAGKQNHCYTLISLITVEVRINVEGVQKLLNYKTWRLE